MRQLFAILFAPILLFWSAKPPEVLPPDYLITEITLACPDRSPALLEFTEPQDLEQVLEYLRSVPLLGNAGRDSMDFSMPLYTIRLSHITGRVTEYRQLGSEYLCKNNSSWHRIAPEDGCVLEELFGAFSPGPAGKNDCVTPKNIV